MLGESDYSWIVFVKNGRLDEPGIGEGEGGKKRKADHGKVYVIGI